MADEIIKEMWDIKDTISSETRGDVRALAERLRKRDRAKDQKVVNLQKDMAKLIP